MTEDLLTRAMEQYGGAVYRVALCRLQNKEDAEDVYQDTFLRLCRQSKADFWDEERLKAWLLRVAMNRCNDIGRQRRKRCCVSLEDLIPLSVEAMDNGFEIWEAVSHLPEKQRMIFHLYYGENYKTREIAAILRIPETSVQVNLNRARTALRKELSINGRI